MGATASRIWRNICAIELEENRIRMIETVLSSPEMVAEAKRAGVYGPLLLWIADMRQGRSRGFPWSVDGYVRGQQPIQQSPPPPPPPSPHQIIVSPAAKALDYFQECLALLGINEEDGITVERLKAGFRAASLRTHPDKPGGSKDAFDEVVKAHEYIKKILLRINPGMSEEDKARMTAPVTMESALAYRSGGHGNEGNAVDSNALVPPGYVFPPAKAAPIHLSAKKLDMNTFNRLFEENRLPDPARDSGYGDWMASTTGSDEPAADPRLKGKFSQQTFEAVFRERAAAQTAGTAIVRKIEPDAIVSNIGTELGGDTGNFTAAFGAETQFMDLKEAYTTGSTRFQEVADVQVSDRKVRSVEEARRIRDAAMARVDPDESSRIAAAAAALEERERQRRLRYAAQSTAEESWFAQMAGRFFVTDK